MASLVWRAPLLAYFAFAGMRHLLDWQSSDLFTLLTVGIHELGHFVFAFFGRFLHVAGGSFWQLAAPLIGAAMFWRQRDYFALCVAAYWLCSSLFQLASYIADARAQELGLVHPFQALDPDLALQHDWAYLLESVGLLNGDVFLGVLTRLLAMLIWLISLAWGGWICWKIARKPENSVSNPS